MTIEGFLQTHFENKIKNHGCLVLYDPDKKYRPPVKDEEIRENPYLAFEIGGTVFSLWGRR